MGARPCPGVGGAREGERDRFILKGPMLLTTWLRESVRETRDLDFLGFGHPSERRILSIFREKLAIDLTTASNLMPKNCM